MMEVFVVKEGQESFSQHLVEPKIFILFILLKEKASFKREKEKKKSKLFSIVSFYQQLGLLPQ